MIGAFWSISHINILFPVAVLFKQLVVLQYYLRLHHKISLCLYRLGDSANVVPPAKKKTARKKGKGGIFSSSIRRILVVLLYALKQ